VEEVEMVDRGGWCWHWGYFKTIISDIMKIPKK
jgi:hypothetical protein